jgi:hypothetical protein
MGREEKALSRKEKADCRIQGESGFRSGVYRFRIKKRHDNYLINLTETTNRFIFYTTFNGTPIAQ